MHACKTCLGHSKKVLGDINHSAEVLDAVHACLDGIGVVVSCSVEDSLDLVLLSLRPLRVHGASVGVDSPVDSEERKHDNRLLIDNVELIADGRYGQSSASGEDGGLRSEAVAGEALEDGVGGGLGVLLWDIAFAARGGGRKGGEGREGGAWECWSQSGSASGSCAMGQYARRRASNMPL